MMTEEINHLEEAKKKIKDGVESIDADGTAKWTDYAGAVTHALIAIAEQLEKMNDKPESEEHECKEFSYFTAGDRCRVCFRLDEEPK